MIMMSTYSGIMVRDYQKEGYKFSKLQVITFKYAEPFDNNYLCRGAVDNHNAIHHYGRKKSGWIGECMDHPHVVNQSLLLFISRTEVNYYFCLKYYLKKYEEFMGFRLILDYSLIQN